MSNILFLFLVTVRIILCVLLFVCLLHPLPTYRQCDEEEGAGTGWNEDQEGKGMEWKEIRSFFLEKVYSSAMQGGRKGKASKQPNISG